MKSFRDESLESTPCCSPSQCQGQPPPSVTCPLSPVPQSIGRPNLIIHQEKRTAFDYLSFASFLLWSRWLINSCNKNDFFFHKRLLRNVSEKAEAKRYVTFIDFCPWSHKSHTSNFFIWPKWMVTAKTNVTLVSLIWLRQLKGSNLTNFFWPIRISVRAASSCQSW